MFLGILGIATKQATSAYRGSWADCYGWGLGARPKRVVGMRYIPTTLQRVASIYRVR